jgi:type II secretory pathway component PulK
VSLLHLAVYTEAAVIVVLLLLMLRLGMVGGLYLRQRNRARRERDEARQVLRTIRRMSEIRVETVTRLRGFTQESQ